MPCGNLHFYSTDDWNFRPELKINEQAHGQHFSEQSGNPTIFIDRIDLDLFRNGIRYVHLPWRTGEADNRRPC
jgi:hypothetical protein